MLVEWGLFLGSAFATFAIGAPIAARLSRQHRWVHPTARDPSSRRPRVEVVRAYAPLDLGEDPVRWPSERLWALPSAFAAPEWPSKSWDDEHFGRQHKSIASYDASERGFHAMAARRHRESPQTGGPAPARTAERAPDRPADRGRRENGVRRQRSAGEPAPKPAPRTPIPREPLSRAPDAAEIEHWMATLGLAGTVQAIMQRTGWEFREAAQYLAKIRKG